jgi:hypothetical protein
VALPKKVKACELQRRSRRFPAGLLDQPFYGWVPPTKKSLEPASAGFPKASAIFLLRLNLR